MAHILMVVNVADQIAEKQIAVEPRKVTIDYGRRSQMATNNRRQSQLHH